MKIIHIKTSLLVIALLTLGSSAFAAESTFSQNADGTYFVSGMVGGAYHVTPNDDTGNSVHNTEFNYGARFGINAATFGDFGHLAFAIGYDRFAISQLNTTAAFNSLMLQVLVKDVAGTGFYFGPEIGAYRVAVSNPGVDTQDLTAFEVGAIAGYDFAIDPSWSVAPEVRYTSMNGGTSDGNTITGTYGFNYLLSGTYHFGTARAPAADKTTVAATTPMVENDGTFYFGILGGLSSESDTSSAAYSQSTSQLAFGARAGMNLMQMGNFAKLAVGVAAERYVPSNTVNGAEQSLAFNTFVVQALARQVGHTNFYFGPELGATILKASGTPSVSKAVWTVGGVAGFDFFVCSNFSMGPEVHYDHYGAGRNGDVLFPTASSVSYLLNMTYHL